MNHLQIYNSIVVTRATRRRRASFFRSVNDSPAAKLHIRRRSSHRPFSFSAFSHHCVSVTLKSPRERERWLELKRTRKTKDRRSKKKMEFCFNGRDWVLSLCRDREMALFLWSRYSDGESLTGNWRRRYLDRMLLSRLSDTCRFSAVT